MSKPAAQKTGRVRQGALLFSVVILAGMGYLAIKLAERIRGNIPTAGPGGRQQQGSTTAASGQRREIPAAWLRLIAKALDPEVMAHTLPDGAGFEPGFKNPCWRGPGAGSDAPLQCLPYAYLLGGFQSGSHTLFAKLAEHPDIVTNEVSRWQFWGEEGKSMREFVSKNSQGPGYQDVKANPSSKVILDASASTLAFYWSAGIRAHRAFQSVMLPCWRKCSEGSKGDKDKLHACTEANCFERAMGADQKVAEGLNITLDLMQLPLIMEAAYASSAPAFPSFRPKLVALLRHPVARVHSAYWQYPHYQGKYGKTAEGFLAYAKEQVSALKRCTLRFIGRVGGEGRVMDARAAERHCALYFEALGNDEEQVFFHADQFLRGMYSIYVEVWLRHFPREDVLVVRSEDYFANPERTLKQVIRHLNITMPTPEALSKLAATGKSTSYTRNAPKMLPEAQQLLMDLYKPYNDHLAELLKDARWLEYNQPPGAAQ